MKNINIPIPAIIACFIFGAWPIGIVLIVLKVLSEKEREEAKKEREAKKTSPAQHTVYHSNYSDVKSNDPDVTYHYSYVKKDNRSESALTKNTTAPPPPTREQLNKMTSDIKKVNYKGSQAATLSTIFFFISLFFAVIFFVSAIDTVSYLGIADGLSDIVSAMIASSVTAVIYLFRQYFKSRDSRIITYLSVLRNKSFYSIKTLADIADVSVSRVTKDLEYMKEKNLLSRDSFVDKKIQYIIFTEDGRAAAYDEYENEMGFSRVQQRQKRAEEKAKNVKELSDNEKTLARIRELNDDIEDEAVSSKIDEIEALTSKIFKLVEARPELETQLDSFLSYYLPTTLKLLNSYAYFEEQGIRGDNINAGMKNIEDTLDMLICGYKNQLDKLFESETLDVTTDINVLEQMMKADGFTNQSDFNLKTDSSAFNQFGAGGSDFATKDDDK